MQASGGTFCPLTGAERKSAVRSQTDAIDPERTSRGFTKCLAICDPKG